MSFNSKKTSLFILGITSIVCSGALFRVFNDPEGPNLVVVIGMAAIVYVLSLAVYVFGPSTTGLKKLVSTIIAQLAIVAGFYLFLK